MAAQSKRNKSIEGKKPINDSKAKDSLKDMYFSLILQVLLRDYADFDLIEHLDKKFGQSSVGKLAITAKKLQRAVLSGHWDDARKFLVAIEADSRTLDTLNEHVAQEMIQKEGGLSEKSIEFIRTHIRDQSICIKLASSVLHASKPTHNRQQLFQLLMKDDSYPQTLQQSLDYALLFKYVVKDGTLPKRRKVVDVQSFIYSEVCLNLLRESPDTKNIDCMAKLKRLGEHVSQVNEFHDTNISSGLVELLIQCAATDSLETVTILLNNPELSQSIQKEVHWAPLMTDKHAAKIKPNFAFLKEYERMRHTTNLPHISTVFELGLVMKSICDPFSVKVDLDPATLFKSFSSAPAQHFPLVPKVCYDLGHPVWSLARSPDSCAFAAGVAPYGAIQVYKRNKSSGEWQPSVSLAEEKQAERIAIDNSCHTISSRCGYFTGFKIEPEVAIKTFGSKPEGHSYGDLLWHPEKPNHFFAARDSEPVLYLYDFETTKEVARWKLSKSPYLMALSEDHIVLLSSKVVDHRQHLIFVNYKTSTVTEYELPKLASEEEVYNGIACSQFDPRTIVLLASPHHILIVDKFGERKPRCINSTRIQHYMMRVRLSGPMDKYIMTTCESKYATKAVIYDRFTGETVTHLQGMRDLSNDIQWIPPCSPEAFPEIVVASDDKSIIIYGQ